MADRPRGLHNNAAARRTTGFKSMTKCHAMTKAKWAAVILATLLVTNLRLTGAAQAEQGAFAPVKIVNNQAVSGFELNQRMQFLALLHQPGDLRMIALDGLIDDRLRNAAAKSAGITLGNDDVMAGMTEFAARANLTAEEFVTAIGQAGIAPETFRDFVSSGLIWRQVVRARYDTSVVISEVAVDRALANFDIPTAQTVTLAEIVLPAEGGARSAALAQARELKIDMMRGRDFAEAARAASSGSTARSGGALPEQRLSQLTDDIAIAVRVLEPGQISQPVVQDGKVYLFKMIARAEDQIAISGPSQVDYAAFLIPKGDAKTAAKMRAAVDNCDDLYSLTKGKSAGQFSRQTTAINAVPADIAGALNLLDAGEVSTQVTRGASQVFLMLCSRGVAAGAQASRDEVRLALKNQRLGALAALYLNELRADALITDP